MSKTTETQHCVHQDRVALFALRALPPIEIRPFEKHIQNCAPCREELDRLRPLVDLFVGSPAESNGSSDKLREQLVRRIGGEPDRAFVVPTAREIFEPEWEEVAPGISCKLLSTDREKQRVSMLVRLGAGIPYPPHRHAGIEELHLLDGELWIDGRKLGPGDYNRAEPGTSDQRVWSETGCMCVLITSTRDALRPADPAVPQS